MEAIKSNAIPCGQMPVGPKELSQNRLVNILEFAKNFPVIHKRIYQINDFGNRALLGKKFLGEYYSISETITSVSKSHLLETTKVSSYFCYDHKKFLTHRYLAFFTSAFRLNTYINRIQSIITSDIHRSVSTLATKIGHGQYQVDDTKSFIDDSILVSVLFRFFDRDIKVPMLLNSIRNLIQLESQYSLRDLIIDKINLQAIGVLTPLQAERRIFKNYVSSIIEEQRNRPTKSSVKFSKFVVDNEDIFGTKDLDLLSHALISVVSLALHLLSNKIYDVLFTTLNNFTTLKRLYDEQILIIRNYGPEITPSILKKMVILDAVIKDAVRSTHTILFASRYLNRSMTFSNGVTLPRGSFISLNGTSIHRNENSQGDSPVFLGYKNFSESGESFSDVSPDNLSWSVGPRMCLAKDFAANFMKEYLAILIREYYFEPLYTNSKIRKNLVQGLSYPKNGAIFIKRK